MSSTSTPVAPISSPPTPVVHSTDDEVLDWDVFVEKTPTRPGGLIDADVQFTGRGRPTVIDQPEDGPSQ